MEFSSISLIDDDSNKHWDLGKDDLGSHGELTIVPRRIFPHIIASVGEDDNTSMTDVEVVSRTEFDSHANMEVVGKHSYILNMSGRKARVQPYSNYKPQSIPIVDSAIMYEFSYDGRRVILVVRDALHVKETENNLIPPFIMREAGLQVKKIPKIHMVDPTVEDHAIVFKGTGFRIPLSLHGIFSCFPTTKPTANEVNEIDEVYMLSPPTWNPHNSSYAKNEESYLGLDGELVERENKTSILLSNVPLINSLKGTVGMVQMDTVLAEEVQVENKSVGANSCQSNEVPSDCDDVGSIMREVNGLLVDHV